MEPEKKFLKLEKDENSGTWYKVFQVSVEEREPVDLDVALESYRQLENKYSDLKDEQSRILDEMDNIIEIQDQAEPMLIDAGLLNIEEPEEVVDEEVDNSQ